MLNFKESIDSALISHFTDKENEDSKNITL